MNWTERIAAARVAIAPHLRRTPVEPSPLLSEVLGVPVWLKLECLQVTGSFKVRGALFALQNLDDPDGVVTCSAGNHGKGLAWAAKQLGVPVTIYVPSTVDASKYDGMVGYGAEVVKTDYPGYDASEVVARQAAADQGRRFVSAFDDVDVIAGNGGTLGAELVEQVPDLATVVCPVSGGGLGAGIVCATDAAFVGVQHAECPALERSLRDGRPHTTMPPIDTVAGGIEGGIGRNTFALLQPRVSAVVHVTEHEIRAATPWMLQHHQYLVEPSGAVGVAAILSGRMPPVHGPVVVVLSGRNVARATLRALLD